MRVEFCGEYYEPDAGKVFVVGREGDLLIDDNPYLHRRFLELSIATATGGSQMSGPSYRQRWPNVMVPRSPGSRRARGCRSCSPTRCCGSPPGQLHTR